MPWDAGYAVTVFRKISPLPVSQDGALVYLAHSSSLLVSLEFLSGLFLYFQGKVCAPVFSQETRRISHNYSLLLSNIQLPVCNPETSESFCWWHLLMVNLLHTGFNRSLFSHHASGLKH